ncbi:hypothetical protein BHE74_00021938 [Ensete ventricosum]|nr:hypothetical protein GW17_00030991 [Ensete ventricosum]RWW70385.1 hypothetical protein BHE74_00021938 [Ensete ventricosum]RZR99159.1 hypothetical protein BHM03_00028652 [Ensete ventricosum]
MLRGRRGYDFQVATIYWKMAAKGSESGGSSDGGGRSGQQRCWLRLRCDFVAAGGVGCNKGAAAIRGSGAAECTVVVEENSSVWSERSLLVVFTSMLAAIKAVLKSSSTEEGVWKVPLPVGADTTMVVHEEDGLVPKDASTEKCETRWGPVGEEEADALEFLIDYFYDDYDSTLLKSYQWLRLKDTVERIEEVAATAAETQGEATSRSHAAYVRDRAGQRACRVRSINEGSARWSDDNNSS